MRRLTLAGLGLFLVACGRESGSSTETENLLSPRGFRIDSILSGMALPSDSTVVATLRLDQTNFDFAGSRPDGLDLDLRDDGGRSLPFQLSAYAPGEGWGRVRVRLDRPVLSASRWIHLYRGLPPLLRSDTAAVWNGISARSRLDWTSLLVDDFEGGGIRSNSNWMLAGTSPGAQASGSGRSGQCLHLERGAQDTGRVAVAAVLLSASPRNLRGLEAVSLRGRGSGRLWLALEQANGRSVAKAWSILLVDSSWQDFRITPADLDASEGASPWKAVRDSVTHLSVWMEKSTQVCLDDFRLEGLVPGDLP